MRNQTTLSMGPIVGVIEPLGFDLSKRQEHWQDCQFDDSEPDACLRRERECTRGNREDYLVLEKTVLTLRLSSKKVNLLVSLDVSEIRLLTCRQHRKAFFQSRNDTRYNSIYSCLTLRVSIFSTRMCSVRCGRSTTQRSTRRKNSLRPTTGLQPTP